jgi:hypothetical protein
MRESDEMTAGYNLKARAVYIFLRYFAAFLMIAYGFAKLNGAQFTILESELDKPMRDVSGFWLTWYYFGYSEFYGNFIGMVQVVAGALLLFRKTTLVAACILLTVVSNIILIDIFYAIDVGALALAVLIEASLLGILAYHKNDLVRVFWTQQNSEFPTRHTGRTKQALKMAVRALVIVVPALFSYWAANYNNRLPTPIDGRWRVTSNASNISLRGEPLNYVYFERNRAYLCVFKYGTATLKWHDFEVSEQTGRLEIWENWLTKGTRIFAGRYQNKDGRLTIEGTFEGSDGESRIELEGPG